MSDQHSFFSELKRRNVVRMAGLYLVGAWLLTQVASTVLPMFGAPDWLPRTVVILLAIGFVPALIFSWVFEPTRSEEHTSELQSQSNIVCRLLLEKNNTQQPRSNANHNYSHTAHSDC